MPSDRHYLIWFTDHHPPGLGAGRHAPIPRCINADEFVHDGDWWRFISNAETVYMVRQDCVAVIERFESFTALVQSLESLERIRRWMACEQGASFPREHYSRNPEHLEQFEQMAQRLRGDQQQTTQDASSYTVGADRAADMNGGPGGRKVYMGPGSTRENAPG